ncbi:methyltransferase [uncultured Roseobacter sp.]|uniref:tRNA1(Val) (adenine(37)-N6)-methyltransferase n=1 Tax=uncultured Roseobacter sp. TaxID=114847 RepID=UPI00261699E9|nr:methyltransferase [uncultured Roseobacter sp.]
MTDDLTCDAFLGGKLHLYQPRKGYRAGIDPVLLAATVPAKAGDTVLDLGCGVGAAALCLGARVPGLELTGVEIEPEYAELARRNGGGSLEVITADIADMPLALRQRQFRHVIANPPYFDPRVRRASQNTKRENALASGTPLATWVRIAGKRLAPGGMAHFIHRCDRLPEILGAMEHDLGSVEVLPLCARAGRPPELVIVRARKSGRGAFCLHAPLILHEGARHEKDGDSYVQPIREVLREGASLPF